MQYCSARVKQKYRHIYGLKRNLSFNNDVAFLISSADDIADITAIPADPVRAISPALSGLIPPIATTGIETLFTISPSFFMPIAPSAS